MLEAIVLLGSGLALFAVWALHTPKEKQADTECAACGSDEIKPNADKRYRCDACGYTNDPGQADARWERFRDEASRLDPGERFDLGIKSLEEARGFLLAAIGTLERAYSRSWFGTRSDDLEERDSALTEGEGQVLEAQQSIRRAGVYLGDQILEAAGVPATEARAVGLDLRTFLRDVVLLTAVPNARQGKARAEKLLEYVERVRAKVRRPSGYRAG